MVGLYAAKPFLRTSNGAVIVAAVWCDVADGVVCRKVGREGEFVSCKQLCITRHAVARDKRMTSQRGRDCH
jgi:hypothetical protein